ncbi:PaaI family thioesterase [Pelagibaculum spongiae]|uniref:Thioesterase n=1 Tax=Pelagibaculum spongiae TaxID=2080658 RepID=A0A2V1GW52_9GAMM|nr:PaaI family thioesterase [Pelagibaculum spongiae]PVZ70635.1 thioesterase [Pelagibaculum spongiae]
MNALEIIRQVQQNNDFSPLYQLIPYASLIGIEFERQQDALLFHMPFKDENIGNSALPALHGGVLGGFMELSSTIHLLWHMQTNSLPRVVDTSVDYLRSGRPITTHAKCEVVRHGRRVANVMTQIWQDDPDKPIATARTHYILTPVDQ